MWGRKSRGSIRLDFLSSVLVVSGKISCTGKIWETVS
jgi:hypothetical protein